MTFSRKAALGRVLSPLALAALAGGGLAGVHAPAMAAKKEKEQPAAPKANYSKGFVAAYQPIEANMKAAAPDFAAAKAAVPGLIAAAETADDKFAAGQMIFSIGQKARDSAVAQQGIDLIVASGTTDRTALGQYSYVGAQLAYNAQDYAKSRALYQTAIDAGFSSPNEDPQLALADAYFADKKYPEGLKYLSDAIAARKAAGQPVNEAWIKRGLAMAYNNKLNVDAQQWGLIYAREFPSNTSWGDAIGIVVNTSQYDRPEMLDLLRLARRTQTMRSREMFIEYIDAADPRKLPNEVIAVMDAGAAAKLLDANIQVVKEARAVAVARVAADKADLPALQRAASADNAKLVTVMAAADTLLSYGQNADAEALYSKALAMPGANIPLVQTRLGIAQFDQGKYAEAQASLAKVQGPRKTIADLWALYAAQKAAPAPAA